MWRMKQAFPILDYINVQIKRHHFSTNAESGILLFNHIFTRIISVFFEEFIVEYDYNNSDND